jgi:hypothetical protein
VIDGDWQLRVTIPKPDGKSSTYGFAMRFASEGTKLRGTMSIPKLPDTGPFAFADGRIESEAMVWTVPVNHLENAMDYRFVARLKGDELVGDVRFGDAGTGAFSGQRVRSPEPAVTDSQ